MKKPFALILALLLAATIAGCQSAAAPEPDAEPVTLTVFAAASLTETLTEIAALYSNVAPGVELVFTFDSSGTLKTQIEEGAPCDIFLSAAQKQMNALDVNDASGTNTDGLDFLLDGTRVDLLENKVALVVPDGNPAGIRSFDDLAAGLTAGSILLAMGNADVPVGQYTQKILAYYGLDEAALADSGVLTYGSNVKEVATQVSEGAVSCGIVYATDAASEGLTVVETATPEMCGQVVYPAAVLKQTQHADAARAFLDYLRTNADAAAVFQAVGFSPIA